MTDTVCPRRALISVSNKTGIVPFARALEAHEVEILPPEARRQRCGMRASR